MALKKIITWLKQSWDNYWLEFESLDDKAKEIIYFENLYKYW